MEAIKDIKAAPMTDNGKDVIKGTAYAILSLIAYVCKLIYSAIKLLVRFSARGLSNLSTKLEG